MSKIMLRLHHHKEMILKEALVMLLTNVLLERLLGLLTNLTHEHRQASRQSNHHLEKQNLRQRIPKEETRDGTSISNDATSATSSMMDDAMKKIDKDKVKAALKKLRKSNKGDVSRKVDVMDDDDLIERELEHGVELAVENERIKQERRQSWPHSVHRYDQQNTAHENIEEGELSMDSQESFKARQ